MKIGLGKNGEKGLCPSACVFRGYEGTYPMVVSRRRILSWLLSLGPGWEIHPDPTDRSSPKAGLGWPLWLVYLSLDGGLGLIDCFWSVGGAVALTTTLSRPLLEHGSSGREKGDAMGSPGKEGPRSKVASHLFPWVIPERNKPPLFCGFRMLGEGEGVVCQEKGWRVRTRVVWWKGKPNGFGAKI